MTENELAWRCGALFPGSSAHWAIREWLSRCFRNGTSV